MRKQIFIFAILVISVFAGIAEAHPLGNFSVNQFSRLEIERNRIRVRQVLNLAEIPTFQESQKIDADRNGELTRAELDNYVETLTPVYLANLNLSIADQPIELRAESKNISTPTGEGNLPTLRVEWNLVGDFTAANSTNRVSFENKNYAERVGWNEIVVARAEGINVFDSTAFANSLSNELRDYPQDLLNAPLAEQRAEFSFTGGAPPENAAALKNRDGQTASAPAPKDKLAELINIPEITPSIVLFGLLLAFGLGALHAMSPGHGKTVVGAYLVGSRGTFKHAVFLGLTVTITHTLGVFALGLITLFASNYILPERIMPFLNFVSGLLVFFIGISLFKERLLSTLGYATAAHHHHEHGDESHTHDGTNFHSHEENELMHTHDGVNYHSHLPPEQITWGNLLTLGISGGLLPCPSALVLMLSAISLGRAGYGLILTIAFSLGLAATLTAVGLIFLYVGKIFDNPALGNNRLVKALPVLSALVVACVGAVICYNSLA
ncbi:MAG TPA: sulfite exporter TauE/SafE family protein [Pyrinomonadaceae bacterium]|jgi:ABC-type nickel/cobalt efflux system permease component RcnA